MSNEPKITELIHHFEKLKPTKEEEHTRVNSLTSKTKSHQSCFNINQHHISNYKSFAIKSKENLHSFRFNIKRKYSHGNTKNDKIFSTQIYKSKKVSKKEKKEDYNFSSYIEDENELKDIGKKLKKKLGMTIIDFKQAGNLNSELNEIKKESNNESSKYYNESEIKSSPRKKSEKLQIEEKTNRNTNSKKSTEIISVKNSENFRILELKQLIYDSMDDDESEEDNDFEGIYISPESKFIFIFDLFLLLSFLFVSISTPFLIANSKCFCINKSIIVVWFSNFVDVIFILDMLISFFRAFYNFEYKLVRNTKIIIINYIKGIFIFDLIESIPFNILVFYICKNKDKYQPDGEVCLYGSINGIFITIKMFALVKILKVVKVLNKKKNRALLTLVEYISDHPIAAKLFNIFEFIILCFLTLNIFICFHIFIGRQSYPNWIILTKNENSSFFALYITSLYFLLETFTTVGYGDIYCSCIAEYTFQIFMLSVGIVAYSTIITMIGDYVKNESRSRIKYEQKLTLLEEIRLEYPKMSFKLYSKIHQHLESFSHQQKKFDLNILVNSLPYSLKNLLLFRVYDHEIKNFNFFKESDNSNFITKVLTSFIPLFSKKNAFLIREGEMIENIVFVKEGRLCLEAAIDLDSPEDSIRKYLGEKFEDILENNSENFINNSSTKENNNQIENIKNIFNSKNQSYNGQSIMCETILEQAIGKCDLGANDDIEEKNYQFLHVLDILKNENFGSLYMLLKKPSPLSLRVKSKKADVFLLRTRDASNIAKTYPNLWKRVTQKSYYNMIGIKQLTMKVVKNYCQSHGIMINNFTTLKKEKLNPLNMLDIKEMIKIDNVKKEEEKLTKKMEKKGIKRMRTAVLNKKKVTDKIKNKLDYFNCNSPKSPKCKYNKCMKSSNQLFAKRISKFSSPKGTASPHAFVNTNDFNKFLKCNKNTVKENIKKSFVTYNNLKINKKKDDNQFKKNEKKKISENLKMYNIINNSSEINNSSNVNNSSSSSSSSNNNINNNIIKSNNNINNININNINNVNNNKSINDYIDLNKTIELKNEEKMENLYPNTIGDLPQSLASHLKKKFKRKKKGKKYYKLLSLKLTEALKTLVNAQNNTTYLNNINNNNNGSNTKANTTTNSPLKNCFNSCINYNNLKITNTNLIFPIIETQKLYSDSDSSSSSNKKKYYDEKFLSPLKIDSFTYSSYYKNLNNLTDGVYISSNDLQKKIESYIREIYLMFKPNIFEIKTISSSFSSSLSLPLVQNKNDNINDNVHRNTTLRQMSKINTLKQDTSQFIEDSVLENMVNKKNSFFYPVNSLKKAKTRFNISKKKINIFNKKQERKRLLEKVDVNINNSSNNLNIINNSNKTEKSGSIIKIKHIKTTITKKEKGFSINKDDLKKDNKSFINKIFDGKKQNKDINDKSSKNDLLFDYQVNQNKNILNIGERFEEIKKKSLSKMEINDKNIKEEKIVDNNKNKNCSVF